MNAVCSVSVKYQSLFDLIPVSLFKGQAGIWWDLLGHRSLQKLIDPMNILSCHLLVGASIWLNASIFLGWGLIQLLVSRNPRYPTSLCMKKDFLSLALKPLSYSLWSTVSTLSIWFLSVSASHLLDTEDRSIYTIVQQVGHLIGPSWLIGIFLELRQLPLGASCRHIYPG